jgi:hypothetical protein
MLMNESLKCKTLFELMTRFIATTNVKGERERAAISSMSPATAKTIYHVSFNLT